MSESIRKITSEDGMTFLSAGEALVHSVPVAVGWDDINPTVVLFTKADAQALVDVMRELEENKMGSWEFRRAKFSFELMDNDKVRTTIEIPTFPKIEGAVFNKSSLNKLFNEILSSALVLKNPAN